ncbi:MAG TPA: serpin family protein [Candidatus Baltobacteraceae bacterium]|jgi:serpin B|nr:serpin family protein [Candidatus Baltobacteraceae bacterium]
MNGRNISATIFRGVLIAALPGILCSQSHAISTPDPDVLISANSDFAFNLLKQLATEQPGTNIFISPYSASTALQMVGTGAAGTTSTEMQQMLGTIDMPPLALYEANKEIGDMINAANTNFVLTTANAVWYLRGFPIFPDFLEGNEKYFGARVEGLDFEAPTAADVINAWASEATQGKIDQIVKSPLDPDLRVLLANAVYFRGKWQYQFDTNATTNLDFYLAGGGTESIPMMQQSTNFGYCESKGYQAVSLPYQGSNLAMYVFLPAPGSSLPELLGSMNGQWWQHTVNGAFTVRSGTVVLPKFNLDYSVTLNDTLEALGMKTAFTRFADFSKISSVPLYISAVKQQAIVEVNEEGTVAAAVTTVSVSSSAVSEYSPFEMIINHPFLFMIEDQQTGTILFMGAVFNP